LVATLLAVACSKAKTRAPAPHPAAPASAVSAQGSAAVAHRYHPSGKVPVAPRRMTPPPGIMARALAVGSSAPDIDLPDVLSGKPGRFHLAGALAEKQRALLVFYRGDW
jgi:hypothetical protein